MLWRNDGVAAASSDGGPTGGRGPATVLEYLVINFSVCLVLLSNCYIYKLQFIHSVNGDGSKTAKIIKKVILPTITLPECQRDAE